MRFSAGRPGRDIGQPDLDERPHLLLEPRLASDRERLFPALARLRGIDALLQPVVAGDEQLADPVPCACLHPFATLPVIIWVGPGETMPKEIRVLIADDHRLFAEALEAILVADERISVVGRAGDGIEAVELARELKPDVILMDLSMPALDGFEATREIRESDDRVRVLVLTGSNSRADVDRSRQAGASGYVTKDRIASELVESIVEVAGR